MVNLKESHQAYCKARIILRLLYSWKNTIIIIHKHYYCHVLKLHFINTIILHKCYYCITQTQCYNCLTNYSHALKSYLHYCLALAMTVFTNSIIVKTKKNYILLQTLLMSLANTSTNFYKQYNAHAQILHKHYYSHALTLRVSLVNTPVFMDIFMHMSYT